MPTRDGLTLRPVLDRDEVARFNTFPYTLNDEIADDLSTGRRRLEWLWLALRREDVVARAGWWSQPGERDPLLMDIFDLRDVDGDLDDGVRLLEAALAAVVAPGDTPPEYGRYLPPDWRDDPPVRAAVEGRMRALESVGARLLVERLRLEWPAGSTPPAPTGQLAFRQVKGAEELIDLMTLVLEDTLDAHDREDLATMTPREAAQAHYDSELDSFTSPHEWWQVATLPGGEPVGFVVPAHNGYHAIIAYLGVLPGHRGHGYARDLVAAGTAQLARSGGATGQGVDRCRQRADGRGLPRRGLRRLRAEDRHDLELASYLR